MKSLLLTLGLSVAFTSFLSAQNNAPAFKSSSTNNHRQAQTKFEGMPPMPFQAFDMKGKTHHVEEYKGKVLVLAFWAVGDEASRNQIQSLNRLQREFDAQNLAIISLADEDKQDLVSFMKNNQIEYPVIPNSQPLGEMGYGGEFGTSRIFVVDKKGVVQKMLLVEKEETMFTYETLKPIVQKLVN